MNQLVLWMIKDGWQMHWRKWKYYLLEDIHLFLLLFSVNGLLACRALLQERIHFEQRELVDKKLTSVLATEALQQTKLIDFLSMLKISTSFLLVACFIYFIAFLSIHSSKEWLAQNEKIFFKQLENIPIHRIVDELLWEKWCSFPVVYVVSFFCVLCICLKIQGHLSTDFLTGSLLFFAFACVVFYLFRYFLQQNKKRLEI